MPKVHLDTDLGGDIDDLCALAMLLRWPGMQISGITTANDEDGRRCGYTYRALELAQRTDIPLAAGFDVSKEHLRYAELGYPDELRYWGEPIAHRPNPPDTALELLKSSIEQGAIIIAIGGYTNLRRLDERYPGVLRRANIVLMGGYIYPPRAGYPQWDYTIDWNVQLDVAAAMHVYLHTDPLIVPLAMTVETYLRRAHLPDLAASGPLGALIAKQAIEFAVDEHNEATYGATCANLPADIINFQHDSLACAIALGWGIGVVIETLPLEHTIVDGWMQQRITPTGTPTRVVTHVDGDAFSHFWCECVTGKSS